MNKNTKGVAITKDEIVRALSVFMADHQRLRIHAVKVEAPLPPKIINGSSRFLEIRKG